MKLNLSSRRPILAGAILSGFLFLTSVSPSWAQTTPGNQPPPGVDPATHAAHTAASPSPSDQAVTQQLSQLQAKVARLEAALAQNAPHSTAPSPSGMSPMPGMGRMGGMPQGGKMPGMGAGSPMGMGQMPMGGMGGAPSGGSMPGMASGSGMGMMGMEGMMDKGMMNMMGGMMGMMGGSMGGMPGSSGAPSALPGFPGASHLYHIGGTGFFLDHPEHITLSTDQQLALNRTKEQAVLAKAANDRQIEQAEQELWTLTASDQPDISKIEAKIREIEKLRADERIAFIRAVGEASKLLTDEQRKTLTGFASPTPMPATPGH